MKLMRFHGGLPNRRHELSGNHIFETSYKTFQPEETINPYLNTKDTNSRPSEPQAYPTASSFIEWFMAVRFTIYDVS